MVLDQQFFNRSALKVAPELLGKIIARKMRGKIIRQRITEVEAYTGKEDKASHASRGRTPRNAPMFGPAGYWYIYFTYGMHWMLNIVTDKKDFPSAVLIRGTATVSGPARLTKALQITGKLNNQKANSRTGLWLEDDGIRPKKIGRTKRIGVEYAGPVWAEKKYRYTAEKF